MRDVTDEEERKYWGNPSEEEMEDIRANSNLQICENCGWIFYID